MFTDLIYSKMSDEQIYNKMQEINRIMDYYAYIDQPQVVEQLQGHLDMCYQIIDEREYQREFEIANKSNEIFNTEQKKEDPVEKKVRRDPVRRRRIGSLLQ